ncbi:D-xylose ABC transporter substrate-binding protein [Variovorax saccharolyticus]|uniref:D-xylose ABC transporter substrate-binding protein n=1 Tax=Variovorax saccharolyticus TaxID=3053516 RepID=UPI002577AF03|nr:MULTISPECIES: D-xylose ABC transporter substrate-binding protein [unclassified Variovorax]MDM0017442.1 D-xylose ABC transporter substrate-binding protein [Variovorax sp. J22R187]MDM0026960.1 D-xylose ABC transporter substrate-binding protein [Variovorax sp. J31P216]
MKLVRTLPALAALALGLSAIGAAAQTVVGVSWSNFQEERWKTDEAAIKAQLEKLGAKYISADAGGSPEKQLGDIEGLMSKGAKALIVLAMDKDAILPAVNKALKQKVPVVAYDRLIETPGVFYITFDNTEVGRMQARAVYKAQPKGNYVMIKGSPTDPNANFLRAGQQEVIAEAVKKGDIKIVGDEFTEGWKPEVAQKNMEQILTKAGNKVDAVVASNDGTAGGAVAALTAKGIRGIPVSGQDADFAALNRIALGTQTVSVWKDSRELGREAASAAVALAAGKPAEKAADWSGGEKKVAISSRFLTPVPITRDNLDVVVKAGWIKKDELCKGVAGDKAPPACK